MHDTDIIELYHARDERAIEETRLSYGRLLYSVAHGVLSNREDSEESVNDTYVNAWNAMPPSRPTALCAFLCRITRNVAISVFRKRHAQKRDGILVELTDVFTDHRTPDEEMEYKELTNSINRYLDILPKDDRILFLKRYFFSEPISDLAAQCASKENQVVSRLYRLRQKLKLHLEKEGYAI